MGAARARSSVKEQEDVLKSLPRGPRARDEGEEVASASLGGAFRDYGGQRGGGTAPGPPECIVLQLYAAPSCASIAPNFKY